MTSTQKTWQATTTSAQAVAVITMPVGTVVSFLGNVAPNGWLICDGSPIAANTYPQLFPMLPNGKLPDLRSRFIVGVGAGAGLDNYVLNDIGGQDNVTLTAEQLAPHRHAINGGDFGLHHRSFEGDSGSDIPFETSPDGSSLYGTDWTGSGQAHENRPPYYALTYIIKF